MKPIDKEMSRLLREYRKAGKTEQWIKSWKRGWYMAGRTSSNRTIVRKSEVVK